MGKQRQGTGPETDPVCGMEVSPEDAAAKSEYKDKTYYFCCEACKEEFEANPRQYIQA